MTRRGGTATAAVLAGMAVALAFAHGVTTRAIRGDNQLYFFMSERCASGVPPHVAQLEVKTQLPTLIGGAAIAAGRRVGIDEVHAGRAAGVAAAAATTVLGWLLVLELTGSAASALVGAAAMLSVFGISMEAANGFQPKLYMLPFLLLAHLLAARRRALGCGAAGAAAFLCWQPAGAVLASCALALAVAGRRRGLARVVAGAALVYGSYLAWFAYSGALWAQLDQEWVLAFGAPHKAKPLADRLWFVLTEAEPFRWRPNALPSVYALTALGAGVWVLRAPRRAWQGVADHPGLASYWVASLLTLAFTIYDHQAHPDMLLVQPYFAVACGLASDGLRRALAGAPAGRLLASAAAAGFVLLGLHDAYADVRRSRWMQQGLEDQRELARLATLYLDHRGSVWALGCPHLLAYNRLDNWVPVGNVGHETQRLDMKTWRPLRDGRMPEVVLAGRGLAPGAKSWLPAEYVDVTPLVFADEHIRVYLRRRPDEPGFDRRTAPPAVARPGVRKAAARRAAVRAEPPTGRR